MFSLTVWAVLHQLGKQGVIDLFDHYLRHAQLLRELISEQPDLELVTADPWAITCFRYQPKDFTGDIDELHAGRQLVTS
ncbi:glutamate decarboxylase [Amycolatopsis xylanica]|uniref:Glutamate decarboxylase n=1 Tax=Amycolatopsis xylanica TaxID=589385 RepID=A0A1H3SF57_9PSEU|nr:hypothetical protein [Amycolatopsis xylanica]SDZ36181.1 glutamate decarboxylase [Amycolatopsis xylanica]